MFFFKTFHYASSDIGKINCNQQISLFNCILPRQLKSSSQLSTNIPPNIDETKIMALKKLSENKIGEIYLGKYSLDNQSKCVLIKIVKTNFINSSK